MPKQFTSQFNLSPSLQALVIGASFIIVLAGMHAAAGFVNAFIWAWLLSILFMPSFRWLQKKGLPSWLLLVLLVLLALGCAVAIGLFLLISLDQLREASAYYQLRFEYVKSIVHIWLGERGLMLSKVNFVERLGLEEFIRALIRSFPSVSEMFLWGFATLIVFIVWIADNLRRLPVYQENSLNPGDTWRQLTELYADIRGFLVSCTYTGLIAGAFDFLLLTVLNVDFAALWAGLAFCASFVPRIGFLIAMIPPLVLTLLEFQIGKTLIILVGYILIHGLLETIVVPRITGRKVQIPFMIIILSLLVSGWVLGWMGLVISIPLMMVVKLFFYEPFSQLLRLGRIINTPLSD